MRKLMVFVIAIMLSACSSCSSFGSFNAGWPITTDDNARYAQGLLDSTAKVIVQLTVDIAPITGSSQEELVDLVASGSGTVIEIGNAGAGVESLVLTAHHVCYVPDQLDTMFGTIDVKNKSLKLLNIAGESFDAAVVYMDESNDLCVLKAFGVVGKVAKIAEKLPPVGAKITHAGAPTGTYGRHLGVVIDGRFAGIEKMKLSRDADAVPVYLVAMSVAADGGSSGGGVFYNGELFAVLVLGARPSGNITWAIELEHIKAAIHEAKIIWKRSAE